MRELFKSRMTVSLLLSTLISFIGDNMFYIAMATFAANAPHAKLAIAAVTASEMIPKMLQVVGSRLAVLTSKKYEGLLALDIIRALLYLIVGGLFLSGQAYSFLLVIVLINFISDNLGQYRSSLTLTLLVEIVPKTLYQAVNIFENFVFQLVNIIIMVATSFLILFIDFSQFAWINAFTFLISASFIFYYRKEIKISSRPANTKNLTTSITGVLRLIGARPGMLRIIVESSLLMLFPALLLPLFQMWLAEHGHLLIGNYAFSLSLYSAGTIIGYLLGVIITNQMKPDNDRIKLLIVVGFPILIAETIALIFNLHFLFLIINVLFSSIVGAVSPLFTTYVMVSVEAEDIPMVMGLLGSMTGILQPLLTILGSFIAASVSVPFALWSVLGLAGIVYMGTFFMSKKKEYNHNTSVQ
ncbi:MAG: hypothetical protein Q4A67_02725 [Aerococcus sp.]|nr:hypothetical protein [Aerococcus sp.]